MGTQSSDRPASLKGSSLDGEQTPVPSPTALAAWAEFRLGSVLVQPPLRLIKGDAGTVTVEPRIMQVLLVLAEAEGGVVTRHDLLEWCWPGVIVGEDSLNRAIAELRRALRTVGEGIKIETIPKLGYRLLADRAATPQAGASNFSANDGAAGPGPPLFARRLLMVGGAAVVAGFGLWLLTPDARDPRVTDLLERGRGLLLDALPLRNIEAVRLFREAAAIAPEDAAAWGWLALALSAVAARSSPQEEGAAFREAEEAARRALTLDPKEPNALAAMVAVREELEDWLVREDNYRAILAHAPNNIAALNGLTGLLQAVGRCRDSLATNERVVALEPLGAIHQQRRALKHWIFGRHMEADRVIDGALERRPRHPLLWTSRLYIYAFTSRPRAALALVDNRDARPPEETPEALAVWRASLRALETRRGTDIAVARDENLRAATRSHGAAASAVMILSELRELDGAFAVAEGFLLRRGEIVGPLGGASGQRLAQDPRWRNTQWLFTPATRNFRADPRFEAFCADIGLTEYWQQRGIRPDDVESLASA